MQSRTRARNVAAIVSTALWSISAEGSPGVLPAAQLEEHEIAT